MNSFFSDSPLLKVVSESGYIHESFKIEDKIISYEHIPGNHPSGVLKSWNNFKEYIDAIKKVHWINDLDYIERASEELKKLGFPFIEGKDTSKKDAPFTLANFKKEIESAVNEYDSSHIDIISGKNQIYGIYHSRHNSFPVTRDYPASIMTKKKIDTYCKELDIGSCEE